MARKATKSTATKSVTVAPSSKSLALVDQELAAEVQALATQIGQPSGNKVKVMPNGDFILPDGLNVGNEIQIIVVAFASRNTFYATPYNEKNITPPDCYAMGRDIATMKPENDAPMKQNDTCAGCPQNAFGSSSNGQGKACRNSREVAFLYVDPNNPEAHNEPSAPVYLISVAPTSLIAFDGMTRHVARMVGPPIKAIVTMRGDNANATGNATFAKLSFVAPVLNPDYAQHVARRAEAEPLLFRRPDFTQQRAAPVRGRKPAAPAGRTAAPRR